MSDLQTRLEAAVGDTYRIEKELGGGGMSFVFLAEEVELGRRVVIKVLPPDMSAGVNKERFQREIKLAASLQHPHIVPLLTAGSADGDLLYYVMPFIEGESLRAKLEREVELPVGEALKILCEVVDALAYAHQHEVVHRDIKPDNVLLSAGHAVVTDFGVAKAVSASSGGPTSGLTSLGVALGTPAYMSPEQAAADPHVDHRADIYSLGTLAYEMLAGRTPFTGNTAQQLLAAHVSQAAEPVTQHRATVPPALAETIMRCLEKKPADRWQTADELRSQLEIVATPQTGGVTPTETQPVPSVAAADIAAKHHPVRVAALFGVAAAVALAVVYGAIIALGLPSWVFLGAVILLAVGLPIMLVTSQHEKQRAVAMTTGLQVTTPVGLKKHFTWHKALLGGGTAFAGLTVLVGGYTAMRTLGIGPVGTLVASGVLEEHDLLLVAEFEDRTGGSDLSTSVTQALSIDLAQSPMIRLIDSRAISQALRRMNRDPDAAIDETLAREIAEREGVKAIVVGDIGSLGSSYVVAARLVSTATGTELVQLRETAADDTQLINAVDRLSAKLRERIGESLKTIRRNDRLEQVTTASLPALRKYSQGVRAFDASDYDRAIQLLSEAIELDSTFAMAYRKLAAAFNNTGAPQSSQNEAATAAYRFRDRLPDLERYIATAYYHNDVDYDPDLVRANYLNAIDVDPENLTALNNLSLLLNNLNDWAEAEKYALRAAEVSPVGPPFDNAVGAQIAQGAFDRADSTVARFQALAPGNPFAFFLSSTVVAAKRDFAAAERAFTEFRDRFGTSPFFREFATSSLMVIENARGKLVSARAYADERSQGMDNASRAGEYVQQAGFTALIDIVHAEAPSDGVARVEAALRRYPLSTMDAVDRPYLDLAAVYAEAGDPDRARELVAAYEREIDPSLRQRDVDDLQRTRGAIALAEGRYQDAIDQFQASLATDNCRACGDFGLARAYEGTGQTDSAIIEYERLVNQTFHYNYFGESYYLPHTYRRLGALYEAQGNRQQAVNYYNEFVELWKDADAELQGQVTEIRNRIARLVGETR